MLSNAALGPSNRAASRKSASFLLVAFWNGFGSNMLWTG
jgi:hypothetical protein